jgi:hypothetical protein
MATDNSDTVRKEHVFQRRLGSDEPPDAGACAEN